MYTVVESWINEFGSNAHRGRLISIYIITTLVGIGIGQQMLGLMELLPLFRIGAIVMLCIAAQPTLLAYGLAWAILSDGPSRRRFDDSEY